MLKMEHFRKDANWIFFIQARSLNHRQSKTFLEEADAEFEDSPYHTEVRWLSQCLCFAQRDRKFHERNEFTVRS